MTAIPALGQCRACDAPFTLPELELGELPVLNRYAPQPELPERYGFALAACSECSLVQLSRVAAIDALVPRVPWISYREPAEHLDAVAAIVSHLLPRTDARVRSLSPFDQPLLDRLSRRYTNIVGYDAEQFEGAPSGCFPYLETLQAKLALADTAAEPCDLLILRYVFEHCREPQTVLQALHAQLKPGGLALIEVPDARKFLTRCDYSFLWEEHACYFTEESLRRIFSRMGFAVVEFARYPGVFEDAMVALVTQTENPVQQPAACDDAFLQFRERYAETRRAYQAIATAVLRRHQAIAVVGIGHQALMFLQAFGLADMVRYVVDDAADKQGTYASGLKQPVISLDDLCTHDDIGLCFLAVGAKNETAVSTKLRPHLIPGAGIFSLFEGSTISSAMGIYR